MIPSDLSTISLADRQSRLENPMDLKERGRGLALLLAFGDEITFTSGGAEAQVRLSNRIKEGVISFDNVSVGSSKDKKNPVKISFELKNHFAGTNLVVEAKMIGDLDMWTLPSAKEMLITLREKGVFNIILNLKNLNYIDSSGLGFFIGAFKIFRDFGGKLVLVELNTYIYGVFKLIQLQHIIPTFDTLETALKTFEN